MIDQITRFDGSEYDFLSNFYPSPIYYQGTLWATVEHAYQAAKFTDYSYRSKIQMADGPGIAKRLGQKGTIREDWEDIKIGVMEDLLRIKFADQKLRRQLLATGNADLIEGNTWNDRFWGECPLGNGQNWLGRLLMKIRREYEGITL